MAKRRRARRIALAAGAALILGLLLWSSPFSDEGGGPPAAPGPIDSPAAVPGPAAEPDGLAAFSVRSGETLELRAASLRADRAVVVDLLFPEPSTSAEPLPVRVLGPDGRQLRTVGAIGGEDRRRATVEIPAEWLSAGRYIVELETTERSHFPLRRYALEVR